MRTPLAAEKEHVMQYAIDMAVANGDYLRAARFAEQVSDDTTRASVLEDIARQAIANRDLASAEDLCGLYPGEISPDVGWEIESLLADFVLEVNGSSTPLPFYTRQSG